MMFSPKVFSWGAGNDPGPVTTSAEGTLFSISVSGCILGFSFLYFIVFFVFCIDVFLLGADPHPVTPSPE